MEEPRKDPEVYLSILNEENSERVRGKLKLFFGYAAGVGKTYAMLQEARQLKAEGLDVVVGYAESHGRAETQALLEGLESLPLKAVPYKGNVIAEFDLDAALLRKPDLILVDELAHSNCPGVRHSKRWQDVKELLDAGIDVYTALNVQHLESLHDKVAQITHVQVRERIPDSFLEEADEIELVDIPTDDLLQRLREGKVYLGERALNALENFFQKGSLIALREMSMRFAAEHVDAQMNRYREVRRIDATWPVADRIVVCVSGSPLAVKLVRAARRMATALHARWLVVAIHKPGAATADGKDRDRIASTLRLAEQLGAEVMEVSSERVAESIIHCAKGFNASKIIVGKPATPRWRELVFGSTLDQLVRLSGPIDVYVISGEGGAQADAVIRATGSHNSRAGYFEAFCAVVLCTGIGFVMVGHFDLLNIVMIYLLGVVWVASRTGRKPSTLASILSVGAFDFFFVPPQLTFAVSDTQYLVTFAVMLIVALIISTLTIRVREQAEDAGLRERRTASLYSMSRELASTENVSELILIGMKHIGEVFESAVATVLPAKSAGGQRMIQLGTAGAVPVDLAVAQWAQHNKQICGLGTDTLPGAEALYIPLAGTNRTSGVLAIRPLQANRFARPEQLQLLQTFAHQLGQACERAHLAEENQSSRLKIEEERLRSTLLSSVSHDLRTPLATIAGTASSIVAAPNDTSLESCKQRASEIFVESERLNRLVTNLLDMTKLESGTLRLNKQWLPVDELIGSALNAMEDRLEARAVTCQVDADLPLLQVDPLLIQQLLVNLLENAIKYTPPGSAIDVFASEEDGKVLIEIADRGFGIAPDLQERVFEKFFRNELQSSPGVGLGLAICKGIAEAHGGAIWMEDNPGGGSRFRLSLPVESTAPKISIEE